MEHIYLFILGCRIHWSVTMWSRKRRKGHATIGSNVVCSRRDQCRHRTPAEYNAGRSYPRFLQQRYLRFRSKHGVRQIVYESGKSSFFPTWCSALATKLDFSHNNFLCKRICEKKGEALNCLHLDRYFSLLKKDTTQHCSERLLLFLWSRERGI